MSPQELTTRGGDRFRPGWLLGALVTFVMGVALTSTWYRRDETVGDGFVGHVYGALALLMWVSTIVLIALAFGLLGRRDA